MQKSHESGAPPWTIPRNRHRQIFCFEHSRVDNQKLSRPAGLAKAIDLAERTFRLAHAMKRADDAVLGYQLRKSALSIPSNIGEGWSRHSTAAYIQHLWVAHASGGELETQIEVGRRLGLISAEAADVLTRDAQEVGRMINGLVASLERGESSQPLRRRGLISSGTASRRFSVMAAAAACISTPAATPEIPSRLNSRF